MPQRLQPLPRDIRFAELGAGLGDVLGALGAGLGRRRERREVEEQREKQRQAYKTLGIPEELIDMPPEMAKLYMQQQQQEALQRTSMMEGNTMLDLLGGRKPEVPMPETAAPAISQTLAGQQIQEPASIPESQEQELLRQPQMAPLGNPEQDLSPSRLFAELKRRGIPSKAALEQVKAYEKEWNEKKRQESVREKESSVFAARIRKEADAAKKSNMRLGRMSELIKSGRLASPTVAAFLDALEKGIHGAVNIGLDLNGLLNEESQEFKKISNDFLKEAKDIFGARLTNFDVSSFLKTVPTLSQSDGGKKRVINNLKLMNQGARTKEKALNQIVKEHGGKYPANLEQLLNKRTKKQLDQIAEKFKKGSKKALPKAPAITGISVVDYPLELLGGALGSILPRGRIQSPF